MSFGALPLKGAELVEETQEPVTHNRERRTKSRSRSVTTRFQPTKTALEIFTVVIWLAYAIGVGVLLVGVLGAGAAADAGAITGVGGAIIFALVAFVVTALFNSVVVGIICLIDIRNRLYQSD